MKKGDLVYVVEALRFGDREMHSYIVGVYRNLKSAKKASDAEEAWRGGKYSCVITEAGFDVLPSKEKLDHLKQVSP